MKANLFEQLLEPYVNENECEFVSTQSNILSLSWLYCPCVIGFGGAMMAAFFVFTGGAVTAKFHLKLHQMAAMVVVGNSIFAITSAMGMFISCEQHDDLHFSRFRF